MKLLIFLKRYDAFTQRQLQRIWIYAQHTDGPDASLPTVAARSLVILVVMPRRIWGHQFARKSKSLIQKVFVQLRGREAICALFSLAVYKT